MGQGRLIVKNGSQDGGHKIEDAVRSAVVSVNDEQIFGPSDFNKNTYYLEALVGLVEDNTILVEVASQPDSYLTIEVMEDIDPPTVTIAADPEAIYIGEASALTWSSINADSASIDQGIADVDVTGSHIVSPNETTTYTITVIGLAGTASENATVTILNRPPVADPQSVNTDEDSAMSITLTGTDPDGDSITYQVASPPTNGILTGTPPGLIYTPNPNYNGSDALTFTVNDGEYDSEPATISIQVRPVNDPPVANDNSATTDAGTAVTTGNLLFNDTDVDGDTLTVSSFTQPANGSVVDNGDGTFTYTPNAGFYGTDSFTYTASDGSGGTDTAIVIVTVNEPAGPPTVSFSATPASIEQGASSTLTWTSTNAQSAHIDNGIGVVSVDGSTTVSPAHTTTYIITVTGPTGSASAQAVIMVTGNPEPQPEGSFGEQYEDLIPTDAAIEEYDPKRFSLITGLVHSIDASPISDVSVTMHGHPEYGTVFTGAEGRFSIPVEGGATMTLAYHREGFITAHRKVYVPWNDIAITETIVMIAEDPASTTLTFDGNSETIVTHQSTEVSDEFGIRSLTMVFTGDNQAFLVDEEGNDIQELTTITTRVTEYTTPESMPAKLPPNSAYTYCAELNVDGAQRVRFEKPIIIWVDNFLGFDVGMIVPVGYYDRDRGVWVPSDNGVVVKLLDTDTDGIVDALDADGDDQPDDLDNDGSFSNEVIGLDDPAKYAPTSTFWRVAVTHFTPWDCNWPYGPPQDAIPPNPEGEPTAEQQQDENKDCLGSNASFVEQRSRIFHEDIPIPGTDVTLHYASNRVGGYKIGIVVPTSGATVADSLKRIIVKLEIAGRTLSQSLVPLPNQKAELIWDGLDQLGRQVTVPTSAHVSVGFVYDAIYYSPGGFAQAFGQAGTSLTGIRARQEVISWKRSDISVYPPNSIGKGIVAEGWSISSHHYVNPVERATLFKGDGAIFIGAKSIYIIDTIAGNGDWDSNRPWINPGWQLPATETEVMFPGGLTFDAFGNLYISEDNYIRKLDTEGYITVIAGNGNCEYPILDGVLAWSTTVCPKDVAVDALGNIYIADTYHHSIRKVDSNGIITTIAGNGTAGYNGDGGLATEASLNQPYSVAVDASGNIYISDTYNHSIRKVGTGGIITTIAGNGTAGYNGDGGQAINARLNRPNGIAIDASGNIYIADFSNYRIRKVDASGIITTVAGNGSWGDSGDGDGGPAIEAQIWGPRDVALDASGDLYIAEFAGSRVRKVDKSGIISTVAGNGLRDYSGDGGPPTEASLDRPWGLVVDHSGNLFISDYDNHRIRKISPFSAISGAMTVGDILFAEENGLGHIISSAGLHKQTIDLDTDVVLREFEYDENNKLISIMDQFNNETTIQRDANAVPTAIISPDGMTTTLTIDANNHLTKITYPDNSFYDFEYTTNGLLTAKIELEGNRFEHVFDSNGRLTDAIDEEGGHWQYSRTAEANGNILTDVVTGEGNLTTYLDHTYSTGAYESIITDPTGAQTLFTQSADGLTVNKSLPCGMELEFKYDLDTEYKFKFVKEMRETTPAALEKVTIRDKSYQDTDSDDIPDMITETVAVNGNTTTLENDVLQSRKTITSPEGRTVTTFYDPYNLLTTNLTIPGLHETTYGYDTRGRLTSINTNTRGTAFAYNAQGFLGSITDPENHTTTYSYDPVGRINGINRPDGTSIEFTYDGNGNMTVLTNPSAIDHGFGYNAVNLNSSYQTPLSGSYSYLYDKDRRLTQINFPSGNQINNIYDKTRLVQIQTPEGNIDLSYLCGTKVGSITKGTESITYGYDGSLLTSETLSGTLSQSLSYAYNNDFNVQGFTYSGNTHMYTYDDDGLLTGAGGFTIFHNAGNGLPESVTGGTLNLSRNFNSYGEVAGQDFTISGQSLTTWNLTRDDNGRIIQKTETVDGTTSNYTYSYDSMGRLLSVTKDGTLIEEYEYGLNGTRTYEMNDLRGISGGAFAYSDEDHLLTAGGAIYEYDLDGFLTTKTDVDITSYDYSSRGELLSVDLPDGTAIEYVHDPLGRRIAKKVNSITVEKYLWQGLTRLLAVYDGSDNLLMRFEYADGRMPVAVTKGGSTYYLTYDQVGSLRIVADVSGNVVKLIDYDSFGNIINDSNPSFKIPFGFAGGIHDRDTGLVRFGYRDYDPDIGRWTAKDPILFSGGDTDLYGYCLNDPVNEFDAIGLISVGDIINWGGTVMAAVAKEGGLIGAKIATGAGVVTGVLGELVDPRPLNAGEEHALEHYRTMQEIDELNQRVADLEKRIEPMLEKFNIDYKWDPYFRYEEYKNLTPCP